MGKCMYCGEDAGLLRKVHKECETLHSQGQERIIERAATASLDPDKLEGFAAEADELASRSYISPEELKGLFIQGFSAGLEESLEDDILTQDEEDALTTYMEKFALTQTDLAQEGGYTKLVKAALLRDIVNGEIPSRIDVSGDLPFNFLKSEQLVWLFQSVPYYEQRTKTTYSGGHSGVSVRVAKGLYWRTGSFRGKPVKHTEMTHVDTGLVAVTNKHVYFSGNVQAFRIRYNKIVSFSPFSDAISIQRDAARAKPQVFLTGDGWFTFNLLSNLAKLAAT